jgi:hypothetical protein
VETAKTAVDSCYVIRQFLTPSPSIDFREIRGLDDGVYIGTVLGHTSSSFWPLASFLVCIKTLLQNQTTPDEDTKLECMEVS